MNSGRFGSASGIHCSINAVLPAFKTFQQITPKSPNPHTRPLRKVFEKTLRCFRTLYQSEAPRQMQDFKNETRGALLRQKAPLPQPAEFYNKSGAARCAKSNGCPSPGNPRHFPLENNFHFVAEVPLSSTFEILHLSAGAADRMKAENRSPISSTFRGGRGCGDGDSERFVGKT